MICLYSNVPVYPPGPTSQESVKVPSASKYVVLSGFVDMLDIGALLVVSTSFTVGPHVVLLWRV